MSITARQSLTETFLQAAGKPFFQMRNFRLGRLLFDQYEGVGASAINQSAGLKAFVAFMKPDTFLTLASPGVVHDSKDYFVRGIETYGDSDCFPLASPFLMANFDRRPAKITGHEGRNRMRAIRALAIADDIPVVIYPGGELDAAALDSGTICDFFNGAVNEIGQNVAGPLFSRAIVGNRLFTAQP